MAGDINAIGILIVPVATAFLVVRFGRLEKDPVRFVKDILLALLLGLFGRFFLAAHLCLAGRAVAQWFVPSVSLALIVVFVHEKPLRWWALGASLAITLFLTEQFSHLVHTDNYTGNPQGLRSHTEFMRKQTIRMMKNELSDAAETDSTSYPEGGYRNPKSQPRIGRSHPPIQP